MARVKISQLPIGIPTTSNIFPFVQDGVTYQGSFDDIPVSQPIQDAIDAGTGAVDSVNGQTGVVVLDTDDISDTATNRYTNDTDITRLASTSGTNTGDNATNSQYSGLASSKQDTLVSGTNIKTINSTSLLGSGDIAVATAAQGALADTALQSVPSNTDATKIADGSVSNTEFQYINSLTSNVQTQLDNKQPLDSDLTTIAGLTATSDNFIQSKSSAWASRTPTQVTADLIAMVGDSGSGGTKGLVPAPAAGDAAASKFLKADGTWTAVSGGGGGTVTSVTSANSDATVATTTTTPVITIVSAPKLTTARAIYGNNFDGSAALTQVIASTYGGTGNGFTKISGPTTTEKTITIPDANMTITAAAATVLDDATTSDMRTTLGLAIGTNVQAYDADLTTWAGITPGTGVGTAIAVNVGTAGAFVTNGGALGTPSSGTLTNATGLPIAGLVSSTSTALGVGSLELGHASDTTLARASAGDVNIEGNKIYRAGGTDVPVTDGGTGVSSTTAYAVLCGGTTSTGALQSIASVGTSGQVLTSNGAGALPTFQTAGGAPTSAVRAYLTTSAQTISTGFANRATVQFNAESFDVDGEFNTGTYTFTPAATGKYQLNIHIGWNNWSSSDCELYLVIGGVENLCKTITYAGSGSWTMDYSDLVTLTATSSTVSVKVAQYSGSNRNINTGEYVTNFSIKRVS